MKDTLIKGLAGFAIGTTIVKTIKEVRQRKLEKEMYKEDEHTEKE